jgi:hypothetical protein
LASKSLPTNTILKGGVGSGWKSILSPVEWKVLKRYVLQCLFLPAPRIKLDLPLVASYLSEHRVHGILKKVLKLPRVRPLPRNLCSQRP